MNNSGISMELANIGLGAVAEKFQDELQKVIANILDPNTEAKTRRKITLVFDFEPNPENRDMCGFSVSAESKLAKTKAYENVVRVGMDIEGNTDATELMTQQQQSLFDNEQPAYEGDNVVPMTKQG